VYALDVFALDDPRWNNLRHAYGTAGDVPDMLRMLASKSSQQREATWDRLWSALCHQGSIYEATFAAVPHVVAIGVARAIDERLDYCAFVGAVAASAARAPNEVKCPVDIEFGVRSAIEDAKRMALASWTRDTSPRVALRFAIALAGLRNEVALEDCLQGISDGEQVPGCPHCKREVFVTTTKLPFRVGSDPDRGPHSVAKTRTATRGRSVRRRGS
jgi:hypothetical protein